MRPASFVHSPPVFGALIVGTLALVGAAGCGTNFANPQLVAGGGSCGGSSTSQNGISTAPRSGLPAGSACSDQSQCAQAVCSCANGQSFYAAACVSGVCNNASACACVEEQLASTGQDVCAPLGASGPISPAPIGPSSCSGESATAQPSPRVGSLPGAPCTDSSQCAEAVCSCASGSAYFAAACVNGVCNNTNACACVEQQLATRGIAACAATPPVTPVPSSCSGESGSRQYGPRSGLPSGAACSDSSQCQEAICDCQNGNLFYASACVGGVCNNASACACVAQQLLAATGQDACY